MVEVMSEFGKKIRASVNAELQLSTVALDTGDSIASFHHLERAHVLGQESTRAHCQVHWAMLVWGLRNRDVKEVLGQVFRFVGALTKTAIGFVPSGNTGGSNVSPFRAMPIPVDLQAKIAEAKGVK